ncbi:LOW QUALITY PROTEIN: golgin subfamily B member 1 [Sarotherodon galilaeus]
MTTTETAMYKPYLAKNDSLFSSYKSSPLSTRADSSFRTANTLAYSTSSSWLMSFSIVFSSSSRVTRELSQSCESAV